MGDDDKQVGEHTAHIQSLHYRLDELKEMLQRQHEENREELHRIDAEIEERVRPLERFKTGVISITGFVTTLAGLIATWMKAKGLI